MKKIIIDFNKIKSVDEFYDRAEEVLGLPDYFGRNLDALYDELTSIGKKTRLYIAGKPEFDGADGVLEVLKDADRVNPSLKIDRI